MSTDTSRETSDGINRRNFFLAGSAGAAGLAAGLGSATASAKTIVPPR